MPRGSTLVVSIIGFVTQEVTAAPTLNIVLEEDISMIEETVVVGYGTQKKASLSSAISNIRSEELTATKQSDVLASRAAGARGGWVIRKHLLPNCISVVIISTALQIPNAIFTESYLSFLGLGVNAPMPSLGSLASDALNGLSSYPFRLVIPAVVISLIVLSLNLFGDGLRDAFDPKLRT